MRESFYLKSNPHAKMSITRFRSARTRVTLWAVHEHHKRTMLDECLSVELVHNASIADGLESWLDNITVFQKGASGDDDSLDSCVGRGLRHLT
jgi:hypothetical protein